jgi:hypothetical protein
MMRLFFKWLVSNPDCTGTVTELRKVKKKVCYIVLRSRLYAKRKNLDCTYVSINLFIENKTVKKNSEPEFLNF